MAEQHHKGAPIKHTINIRILAFNENVCGDMHDGASRTCCSREMLIGMAEASEHELRRLLNNLLETTAENFRNDTIVLKSFVADTLGTIMEQLHSQLRTDFSYKFRSHEQFFINFFSTIQLYLSGTVGGLPHLVSSFFDELLWRITQILLNTNSTDNYTKCVVDSLRPKQPFLRFPSIITNMTMEAFPPIRAAINSMAFARETLLAASITIHLPRECFDEYQRLKFCSLCAGIMNASLCESTCVRLAETCTPQQLALGTQWKKFIAALQEVMNLVDKFPKVHRPLQMHLTDAIMSLKSVYSLHEQEILGNCSSSFSQGENVTSASAGDSGREGGGRWPFSGHRRARRQSPVIYHQPFSPLRPHAFEARPLPTVALGEQGIASLQAWARDVKHQWSMLFSCRLATNVLEASTRTGPKFWYLLLRPSFLPPASCWAENNYNFIPRRKQPLGEWKSRAESVAECTHWMPACSPTLPVDDAPYNKVAHLFANLGLEICNSETAKSPFGGSFAPSDTCWNGTSLVSSAAMKSYVRRGQLAMPTDPTLRQKELGLRRAVINLQRVASSTLVDPEVLQLADPAATTLKVGRNEVPVNSDEEALRSYLVPSNSTEASLAHNAAAAALPPWDVQPPLPGTPLNAGSVSRGAGFEPDTETGEEGSGYGGGEVPLPYGSPFAPPLENDLRNQPLGLPSASHPLPPAAAPSESTATTHRPSLLQPSNNFVSGGDDEDFRPRIEPMNVYGFPEATQQVCRISHIAFDAAPGVPLTHWDTESNSPEEGSGREPLNVQLGLKPLPSWTGAPQSPQPHPPAPSSPTASQPQPYEQNGDAGLVIGEGKLEIPDQIWVPEGDGVAHQYPSPSHPRTSGGILAFAPSFVSSLFPIVVSLLLFAMRR
ncbi:Glypican-4 [Echinococcus granulosus]|uniref:Glypican-4 n=1 Tax=Echinococcus granulosus TaxID=6210 RepID=W6UUT5_ECHGR|nr:Glypican-4 [Echinococcus granulosus]EUB65048.1 Glypican-4 [Echinococcus granulosus]